MIPRHPNAPRTTLAVPRMWADAYAVAARLCRFDDDTPTRYCEESATQLIAALLLAASYTSRPAQEAIVAWLRDPRALEDTARPILEQVESDANTDAARRRDARAALTVLRRGDHDRAVATATAATARRRVLDATSDGPLVAAPSGRGKTVKEAPEDLLAIDGPVLVASRRTTTGERVIGRWSL